MRWTPGRMLGAVVALAALGLWLVYAGPAQRRASPSPSLPPPVGTGAGLALRPIGPTPATVPAAGCAAAPGFAAAASRNAQTVQTLAWSPWGRAETGWEVYAPLVGQTVGSACPVESPAFAAALAAWQGARDLPASGVMDGPTYEAMRVAWIRRRPFVAAMAGGCPAPATPGQLADARPDETYAGKPVQVRTEALAAYRALVAAARAESAAVAQDRRLLTIFSGFRLPTGADDLCMSLGGCPHLTRASCSAHRTGLAFDLFVGNAPGRPPESADDVNRLFQSRGPAYRWMVANADRFGFVPYPFEPWHWEWTGVSP